MHFDFSQGVDFSISRLLMADNRLNKVENGELIQIGSINKVRGYSMRGAAVHSTYNILGMVNAVKASDGTRKQIVIADGASNSDAYTYNPITNTWTPHVLSLTTGARAEFESFLNGFFMVNFSDATRFNNLSVWSTATNVTSAAKAKYIKLYLGRIYLAYVVSAGTTYPSRVTYSDLPSGSPLSLTWNDSLNYFDVDSDNGDVITGLEVNASRLLIFKENSLYRYDTNTLYQVPGCPGTVSQRSVKNIHGHTLYLHSSGIWDYNGESSQLISRRITDIIEGTATRSLAISSAMVKGDHYYLFLGDINNTKTGLTISKCLLDYDIAAQAFTWRSLKDNPLVFMDYPDDRSNITYNAATLTYNDTNTTYNGLVSSEDKIYFGTDDGNVMQFDTGNDFNGTDIALSIETKDYYLGYPAFWKLLQKVVVFNSYGGRSLVVQAKLDDSNWITLGRVTKTQNELRFPSGAKCQRVRFRIMESSSSTQFAFEGLDIYFTAQGLLE